MCYLQDNGFTRVLTKNLTLVRSLTRIRDCLPTGKRLPLVHRDMSHPTDAAFSIRRLNPLNGVLQIFQTQDARALSDTGISWEIQVLSDTPQGLWANTPFSERRYYTFGIWSSEKGLEQIPINPLFNIRQMIAVTERLVERLEPASRQLPFPLDDPYERWLLDGEGHQPIALLESRQCEALEESDKDLAWMACAADDYSFISPTLSSQNPSLDRDNPRQHADLVELAIRQRAGPERKSRWFKRQGNGSAISCDDPEDRLGPEHFPELLLTQDWTTPQQRDLIQDYLDWKAPQLLMLPNITDKTREHLERMAFKQAEVVDRLWRLYPQIHNHDLLKSARVEAKIRSANRN